MSNVQIALDKVPTKYGTIVVSTVNPDYELGPETRIWLSKDGNGSEALTTFGYENNEQARGGHEVWVSLIDFHPQWAMQFVG